jgi:hypothetical protein
MSSLRGGHTGSHRSGHEKYIRDAQTAISQSRVPLYRIYRHGPSSKGARSAMASARPAPGAVRVRPVADARVSLMRFVLGSQCAGSHDLPGLSPPASPTGAAGRPALMAGILGPTPRGPAYPGPIGASRPGPHVWTRAAVRGHEGSQGSLGRSGALSDRSARWCRAESLTRREQQLLEYRTEVGREFFIPEIVENGDHAHRVLVRPSSKCLTSSRSAPA